MPTMSLAASPAGAVYVATMVAPGAGAALSTATEKPVPGGVAISRGVDISRAGGDAISFGADAISVGGGGALAASSVTSGYTGISALVFAQLVPQSVLVKSGLATQCGSSLYPTRNDRV